MKQITISWQLLYESYVSFHYRKCLNVKGTSVPMKFLVSFRLIPIYVFTLGLIPRFLKASTDSNIVNLACSWYIWFCAWASRRLARGGITHLRLAPYSVHKKKEKDITAEFVCICRLHYSAAAGPLRGLIVKKERSCELLASLIAPIIGIMGLKRKRHFILITEQLYQP